MQIEREVIRKNIIKKGFVGGDNSKTDHEYYFLVYQGKIRKDIWIRLSRGSGYKTYSKTLLERQARILGIRFRVLFGFCDCSLEETDLVAALRVANKII